MSDIAVINAVKAGQFECTILANARGSDIQGAYCLVPIENISAPQDVLCRVGYVDLINPIHENISFAPIIMARGSVPHFSGDADIEKTQLEQVSVIDRETGDRVARRANPPSGTRVRMLNAGELVRFENERVYRAVIGTAPHDADLPVSVINRHYGPATDDYTREDIGGWGEAHHETFFGQNGSGKTVHALARIAARLVAHPQMGFFCPDTAGDISQRGRHNRGKFRFDFYDLMERGGCKVELIDIRGIALESEYAYRECLAPLLTRHYFGMTSEKANELARRVSSSLLSEKTKPGSVEPAAVMDAVVEHIGACYAKSSRADKEEEAVSVKETAGLRRRFESDYEKDVRSLFTGRYPLRELMKRFLDKGARIVLQMHTGIKDKQQDMVMREIFSLMKREAEKTFHAGKQVNAMVLLDEGPRWVAQGTDSAIANHIKDAFNTTRKYGLGWSIISQRLATIDKNVIAQSHTKWFGRGLNNDTDRRHMIDEIGKNGWQTYETLSGHGGYFWIGVGQDANVGTESTYFSLRPFGGDSTEAIIKANPHIWRGDVL